MMSPSTTIVLLTCALFSNIARSRLCSEQNYNCSQIPLCSNELSTLGSCVSSADNDPNWLCTYACKQSLRTYLHLAAPDWIPDETLHSCECDPVFANDTSCSDGVELLVDAGCGQQFAFPEAQHCVITPEESDTIYVSSLGSDNATTCGAVECPCGTIGYAFFLATNDITFADGSYNHYFDSQSITIHIDGVHPEDLLYKQNWRKCGIYVYYNDWEHQGSIDPMYGVGTLDHKENITFNFGYVRRHLGYTLRVRERNDWYPCGHEYCSPRDGDPFLYCDGVWQDIFRKPIGNGQEMVFDEMHQIKIYFNGLIWDNIFRKKQRGVLIHFGGDPRITTYVMNARIDNIYVDTSQTGIIIGQSVEISDSIFENIVIFNEATGSDVIFDDIKADQYLFGDLFYETKTPQIKWVQGFKFIRTQFKQITQYDAERRFLVMSGEHKRHNAMQLVFDKVVNVTTQSIDVDLAIISLPMATFSTWMEYAATDCLFESIYRVDLMRSDPGVLMTAPWNISNTMFRDIYDCSVMVALTRTQTYFENIYVETSTMRDVTQIEEGLFIFDGQTSTVIKNLTYNYVFPIKDGVTALNRDILDVTRNILECLNKPGAGNSYTRVGQRLNKTSCNIAKYPQPLLVNEGDVAITDLTTLIEWDKQQFIDMVQIHDFSTYSADFKRGLRNLVDLDTYPCLREQNDNCVFYPILYDYYDFEWFVGANFDVSLILNGAGASLHIDTWYTDREIHNALIYNTGSVVLSGVTTNYYHQFIAGDGTGVHDPNDLHGDFCFFHGIGTFEIRDSKIFGCGTWAFAVLESDSFIVDNVEVRWSAIALSSTNLANNVEIRNSEFVEVGLYYASIYYLETAFALVQTPPFAIAGTSTYFVNCLFSFYDPIGFIHAPYSLFNRDYTLATSHPTQVMIESSQFIVEVDSSNIVLDPSDILAAFNFSRAFKNDALILLDDNTELTFISNRFEGNPLDETVPLLKINNSLPSREGREFTNCMLDNDLTNYALHMIGGKMLPCHLEDIVDLVADEYYGECLPTLGALNPVYGNHTHSYFTKSDGYSGALVVIDRDDNSRYASFGLTSANITIDGDRQDAWQPIELLDGWLVLSETNYPESASLQYDENACVIHCYKYVNSAWNDMVQFIGACDASISVEPSMISLEEFALQQAQAGFSFAHVVELELSSYSIYPGGKFQLNGLNIKDAYNQDALDYVLPITTNLRLIGANRNTSANLDVDIEWSIHEDIAYCNISERVGCYWCSQCGDVGLVVQSFTMRDLEVTDRFNVIVTLMNDSTSLFAQPFTLQLMDCPSGLGVNPKTDQCEECDENTFSFYATRNNCTSCAGLEGITCPGHNEVRINVDYWFQFDIEHNNLLTSDCPTGYCCQNRDGCTYFGNNSETALCAVGRDPTQPMCGQCLEGLSEYLGSVDCGPCQRTAAAQYNILVLILTAAFCWYTVYFSRYRKEYVQQLLVIQNQQLKNKGKGTKHQYHFSTFGGYFWDKFRMLRVQLYKPIMYYFQSLTFILQQGGITVYLLPLLNLFNLSIDVMNTGSHKGSTATGFCLYKGLQARGEIAIGFMVPSFLLFELGVCGAFCRRRRCCGKEPAVGIAFWAISLMSMGVIFNTVLKAIACREINGSFYLFYAGAETCFDWSWYLHVLFLFAVIIVFVVLFLRLKRYDVKRRQHPNFSMRTFILPYKSDFWFWEFVLLSRRFMVAFVALFPYSSKQYLNMFLLLIFTGYLSIHIWLRPFYHPENNGVEAVCLFCSICVIAFLGFLDDDDAGIKAGFVTICILIPLMFFMYYIATICCFSYHQKNNMQNLPTVSPQDNDDMNALELMTQPGIKTVQSGSIDPPIEVALNDADAEDINEDGDEKDNDNNESTEIVVVEQVENNNDNRDGGDTDTVQ